jgi:demethylmenaquinone methyltransferase/2-methoxy-6-polyprenyl-1,4-benzoquinol methylase
MSAELVRRFFTGTGPTYELIVNLFTHGADRHWKKRLLAHTPASAAKILDLGCGTGILTFALASRFPASEIVGVDMMPEYIVIARHRADLQKIKNVRLICARAEQVKLRETFDCITSSYVPKYVAADQLLKNISPFLKTTGRLLLHDFAYPQRFLLRKIWGLHVGLMKYFGTPIFPQWKTIFYELADLVRSTQWISEYREALPRFGYKNILVERLTAGSAAIISAEKG